MLLTITMETAAYVFFSVQEFEFCADGFHVDVMTYAVVTSGKRLEVNKWEGPRGMGKSSLLSVKIQCYIVLTSAINNTL